MPDNYMIRSAFSSPADEFNGSGKRPVIFDIIGPDKKTSMLPDDLKMVLHVNPTSMQFTYQETIPRVNTMAGWVEFHWGAQPTAISFNSSTGGFVRLYSGLSNITGPVPSGGLVNPSSMRPADGSGTRRDTIAYDKYLDLLGMFKGNGAIYDVYGNIALQGQILMIYDGGSFWGYMEQFSVEESVEKPYSFELSVNFLIDREKHTIRTTNNPVGHPDTLGRSSTNPQSQAQQAPSTAPNTPPEPFVPNQNG